MRALLIRLGFSIPEGFEALIGLMAAAQRLRFASRSTGTQEVTRTTAFAILLSESQVVLHSLQSFGLQYDKFLELIGLKFPVGHSRVSDIDIYPSLEDALIQYAISEDAVLTASNEVLAIAILQHALIYKHISLELEERLRASGLNLREVAQALTARALPFDPRRQYVSTGKPQASDLQRRGHLREAQSLYEGMARRFPNSSAGLLGMAETLRDLGDFDGALSIYEQAAKQFPNEPTILAAMAETLRNLGRSEDAVSIDRRRRTQFPDSVATEEDAPFDSNEEKRTTAPFYSDHAARRDLLNRKAVAETIATMVDNVWKEDGKEGDVDRTFMIHLHGRWGSGKTSILNFLKDALLSQRTTELPIETNNPQGPESPAWIIVDYNAWRNQRLGPAWWTLLEAVYRQASNQLRGWRHWKCMLGDYWWRTRSSYTPFLLASIIAVFILLGLIWMWRVDLFDQGKPWFSEALKMIASAVGVIVTIFAFGHNYQIGSARTARSYLELSRDPLSPLTRRYGDLVAEIGRPIAVFIDDLDRCNAEFVVEILQTIQTLFRQARVLYVVAADRDWVCASYQQQYKSFSETIGEPGKSLGHLFLEKIFQLSIEVPRLTSDEKNAYWDDLINARFSEKLEENEAIIVQIEAELAAANTESAIIRIVENYRGDPVRAEIAAAKGFQRMQAAPIVREREHFLSRYANLIEPNPRAMKRLLNAYGFRRGFDIQSLRKSDPDALVRWTILENRWPILADHLEGRSGGRVGTDIIEALKRDRDVLQVANGLTWEKLEPVASAPDQPPSTNITPGGDPNPKATDGPQK